MFSIFQGVRHWLKWIFIVRPALRREFDKTKRELIVKLSRQMDEVIGKKL